MEHPDRYYLFQLQRAGLTIHDTRASILLYTLMVWFYWSDMDYFSIITLIVQ